MVQDFIWLSSGLILIVCVMSAIIVIDGWRQWCSNKVNISKFSKHFVITIVHTYRGQMDEMEGQEKTEFQGEMEKTSLHFRFLRILSIKLSRKVNENDQRQQRYF